MGSDIPILRPLGQYQVPGKEGEIGFGLSTAMDYELEMVCIIGRPAKFGEDIRIAEGDEYIFGVVLMKYWSSSHSHPRGNFVSSL